MIDYTQVPYHPCNHAFDNYSYQNQLSFAEGIPLIANSSNHYPSQMYNNIIAEQWLQFLNDQYHPKCPQYISPPEVSHASPRTRVSLTLSDPSGENERPRLIPVPAQSMDISQTPSSRAFYRRGSTRSHSISSTCSSSSWCSRSSWSSVSSESSMEMECDLSMKKMSTMYNNRNKNKVLPPPTLPPILVPAIPENCAVAAAFYSVKAASYSNSSMCSLGDDSSSIYSLSSEGFDSDDESLSDISSSQGDCGQSALFDNDETFDSHKGQYMTLTSSIWGPGWHQVEPLPSSFVEAMHQSELEAQKKLQIQAQEKALAHASANPKLKSKKAAKQQARVSAALAVSTTSESNDINANNSPADGTSPTSPAVGHSARLPRSLQFVEL